MVMGAAMGVVQQLGLLQSLAAACWQFCGCCCIADNCGQFLYGTISCVVKDEHRRLLGERDALLAAIVIGQLCRIAIAMEHTCTAQFTGTLLT
jgi:hypothetical protein